MLTVFWLHGQRSKSPDVGITGNISQPQQQQYEQHEEEACKGEVSGGGAVGAGGQPGAGLGAAGPPLAELALRAGQDGGGVWAVVTLQHMVSSQLFVPLRCRTGVSAVKEYTTQVSVLESDRCT